MDKGKKSFLWLIAVFVAPILLGTLLFFNLDRLGIKRGSVNYGTLIQPAFPTKVYDLLDGNKTALREDTLAKKWTLLFIKQGECNQRCLEQLLLIKRVRLLMNEQMRRVRTVFVSNASTTALISKKENSDLVLTNITKKEPLEKANELSNSIASPFLKQFPQLEIAPIYLLDPLGNLMMYYPQAKPNAKRMIKDLQKLLKYSHLG